MDNAAHRYYQALAGIYVVGCLIECEEGKRTMPYRRNFRLALILALIVSLATQVQSQTNDLAEVFAPVDAALRPRLSERLKLYVEYERTHQWDKLYDLTARQGIEKEAREIFVKRQRDFSGEGFSDTLDFVPQATVTSYVGMAGNYFIEGCMKVRWKSRIQHWHAGVDAFLENGDWYFSHISAITGIDAPPRPCRKQQKSKVSLVRPSHPTKPCS